MSSLSATVDLKGIRKDATDSMTQSGNEGEEFDLKGEPNDGLCYHEVPPWTSIYYH